MPDRLHDEPPRVPDRASLRAALGPAVEHFEALRRQLETACGAVTLAWKDYGAKHGWQLKALRGGRAFAYLIPHQGCFTLAMALDADEVTHLLASDLPAELLTQLRGGRTSPEGRPVRVEVADARSARLAARLLQARAAGPSRIPATRTASSKKRPGWR
jgi:Protein of unknown function (DUF3788)